MKRIIVLGFLIVQMLQLYVMYNFWQMDARFVNDTQAELQQHEEQQTKSDRVRI